MAQQVALQGPAGLPTCTLLTGHMHPLVGPQGPACRATWPFVFTHRAHQVGLQPPPSAPARPPVRAGRTP
jgi:hypothetical protein